MRHALLPMSLRERSAVMRSAVPAACRRLGSFRLSDGADLAGRASRHNCGATLQHRLGWLLVAALAVTPALAAAGHAGSAAVAEATSAGDGAAAAAKGTTFEVPRHVIAGGGGNFVLEGTIGQAEIDPLQPSSGGAYAITGGFWFDAVLLDDPIFADDFEAL